MRTFLISFSTLILMSTTGIAAAEASENMLCQSVGFAGMFDEKEPVTLKFKTPLKPGNMVHVSGSGNVEIKVMYEQHVEAQLLEGMKDLLFSIEGIARRMIDAKPSRKQIDSVMAPFADKKFASKEYAAGMVNLEFMTAVLSGKDLGFDLKAVVDIRRYGLSEPSQFGDYGLNVYFGQEGRILGYTVGSSYDLTFLKCQAELPADL